MKACFPGLQLSRHLEEGAMGVGILRLELHLEVRKQRWKCLRASWL